MLLAIDTSANLCAAAIYDGDRDAIVADIVDDIGRGHAERLMEVIGQALEAAGCDYGDLSRIAATRGPGSFTGIRVGLATARGIGLGLSVPVLGICGFSAMRLAAEEIAGAPMPLLVAVDARRDEAFCRFFSVPGEEDGPFVARYEEVAVRLNEIGPAAVALCGSAAESIAAMVDGDWRIVHELAAPPVACIARLGARLTPQEAPPEPLYIRAADAKPQTSFALQRA